MSSHKAPMVNAQFLTDVFTNVPVPCERSSCGKTIQPGEHRLYIANFNQELPGCYVCERCYQYYRNNPDTLKRTMTAVNTKIGGHGPPSASNSSIDLAAIRQQVIQSQRQGSHTAAGRVTPLPSAISIQLPNGQQGPIVGNPAFFGDVQLSGYSQAHSQYAAHRQAWASRAYRTAPPPPHPSSVVQRAFGQLPLRVQQRREVAILLELSYESGKAKPTPIGIKEGVSVDYEIYPPALMELVKSTLIVPMTKFRSGFPWDFTTMILREAATWQDISRRDPTLPYFSGRFIKAKTGTKSDSNSVFSPPAKPIGFQLIVDYDQWEKVEGYMDELFSGWVGQSEKRKLPPSPEKNITESHVSSRPPSKKAHTTVSRTSTHMAPHKLVSATPPVITLVSNPSTPPTTEPANPTDDLTGSIKEHRLSQSKEPQPVIFVPLKAESIRDSILSVGGQSQILEGQKQRDRNISERLTCYTVNVIPFSTLCDTAQKAKVIINDKPFQGHIFYDPRAPLLGRGTFKTAMRASLVLSQCPNSGLGADMQQDSHIPVALKRPFESGRRLGNIRRLNTADESAKIHTEAILLGWAQSLLDYTYNFIDTYIQGQNGSQPPLEIPRVRFVHAIIAYAEGSMGSTIQATISHRAIYLLEELLDESIAPFIKYVHNGFAAPLPEPDEPGYELAEFLCFLQHVQYVQTHGQVYISDFQGSGLLLTDPQIMTKPEITNEIESTGRKESIFGEGNVGTAFDNFTVQHSCNVYCKWFELEQLHK